MFKSTVPCYQLLMFNSLTVRISMIFTLKRLQLILMWICISSPCGAYLLNQLTCMVDKDELLCTTTDASGTYRVDRMPNSVTCITFLTLGDKTYFDLRSQLRDLKSVIVK